MAKNNPPKVIIDKKSTYGKKPPVVINSQGTPEHKRDPIYTMSAHDKAELFIRQMQLEQARKTKVKSTKSKSKRGGKKN